MPANSVRLSIYWGVVGIWNGRRRVRERRGGVGLVFWIRKVALNERGDENTRSKGLCLDLEVAKGTRMRSPRLIVKVFSYRD